MNEKELLKNLKEIINNIDNIDYANVNLGKEIYKIKNKLEKITETINLSESIETTKPHNDPLDW